MSSYYREFLKLMSDEALLYAAKDIYNGRPTSTHHKMLVAAECISRGLAQLPPLKVRIVDYGPSKP